MHARASIVLATLIASGAISAATSPRWSYGDTPKASAVRVREAVTLNVGDSVFVGFFVRDQPPHVFPGGATFATCGAKQLYARFYRDRALTKPITGDSIDVAIPCSAPAGDTTKMPPDPLDTTKMPPPLGSTIGANGLPLCAGAVSDTSVHLPFCSRPQAWPMYVTAFNGPQVTSCWTSVPREALTFNKQFDCAETTAMLARTNVFPTTW